jgi:hypothetical protein
MIFRILGVLTMDVLKGNKTRYKFAAFFFLLLSVLQTAHSEMNVLMAKAGTPISFYTNGKVKGFILAKDYNYKQGRVWKANTEVVLHSNGGPQQITFFTFSCRKEHGMRR